VGASAQNRKYNGKEFVEMHGWDTYDFGARGMYAAIGRWTSVDPLAEKYYNVSPYVYCHSDPVNKIDPDGRGDENSGGTPSRKNKVNGVPTAAQSSTYRPAPKEKVSSMAYNPPIYVYTGEIKDANKVKAQERFNQLMSDPIGRSIVSDPTLKAVSVGGGAVTASILTGAVATTAGADLATVTQATKEAITPLVLKTAQVALENSDATLTVLGGGFGIMYSLATGETQDLPQFTTGLPAFDNASQVTQTGMTVIEFYNQCIKPCINLTPQSPANNSTQQSDKKNE
jgi:RHS repeat-associated protein